MEKRSVGKLDELSKLPDLKDVVKTNQYIAQYCSELMKINPSLIKDFEFRMVLDMMPHPITWITNNFVQHTLSRGFYFTGTKWKPHIDEHRKYTNYTGVACKEIANGSYWEPFNTAIKGGMMVEIWSVDPGIAFDILYDGNHIQVPATNLATDGIPTFAALHNLGGETMELTELQWNPSDSLYGVMLAAPIWWNENCTVQILNATGAAKYAWFNAKLPAIDDYYDTKLITC